MIRSTGAGLDRRDWTGLDWTGLDWTGLDWTGLDWTGLDWTGLGIVIGTSSSRTTHTDWMAAPSRKGAEA